MGAVEDEDDADKAQATGRVPGPECGGDEGDDGQSTSHAGAAKPDAPAVRAPTSETAKSRHRGPLPVEVEQALSFETPKAGKSSVYVPNPATNRVAVVNAGTFNIEDLPVGSSPKFAATVPGQDVALGAQHGHPRRGPVAHQRAGSDHRAQARGRPRRQRDRHRARWQASRRVPQRDRQRRRAPRAFKT